VPCGCGGAIPQEVAGEADVLSHQRRGMGEQLGRQGLPIGSQMGDGVGQVGRVPIHDGSDRQIETRCTELLSVLAPVGNAPLLKGADHLGQCVALLAFVQACLAKLPELGGFQPIQHELRSFDASQLLQCKIKLILALKGSQAFQHC
jgi:hypothetical protein